MTLRYLRCRVKPATPHDIGRLTWDKPRAFMDKQEKDWPLEKRLLPCHRHGFGWIEQCPWCMRCEDGIWHLDMDGKPAVATFLGVERKTVEIVVKGSGEVLRYRIGEGFI